MSMMVEEGQTMNQCEWCSTTRTKRWHKTREDPIKPLCHGCYRSVKNGYIACALCEKRRFCKRLPSGEPLCFMCQKIDLTTQKLHNISCVQCKTFKSMDWHTTSNGDHVCLYCFHEEEEVEVFRPKKKTKKQHKKRCSREHDCDDIEGAALLLCEMLVMLK